MRKRSILGAEWMWIPITAVLSHLLFFIEIPRVSIDAVEFSHEDLKTTPRKPCQKLTW